MTNQQREGWGEDYEKLVEGLCTLLGCDYTGDYAIEANYMRGIVKSFIKETLATERERVLKTIEEAVEFERVSFWSPDDGGLLTAYTKGNNEVVEKALALIISLKEDK